jgi:hypothetical protein
MVCSVSDALEVWKMFICAKPHFDTSLFLVALAVPLQLYSVTVVTERETYGELSPCTVNEGKQMALTAVIITI